MMFIFVILAIVGGLAISAQSSINGIYAKKVGVFESAFVSFVTGAMILTIFVLFIGEGKILHIFEVPKWQLTSAFLGVFFIFIMVLTVTKIGVTATNVTAIIGQIFTSIIIDHFGWFGKVQIDFDWKRWIGVAFMLLALYLLFNDSTINEEGH